MSVENNAPGTNEVNHQGSEFFYYPEFSDFTETSSSGHKSRVAAVVSSEEATTKTESKKPENKIQSFFRKMLISTTVAVAAVITAESVGVLGATDVSVKKAEVYSSSETVVSISMELEGYQDGGDELIIEAYNDFERVRGSVSVEEDHDYNRQEEEYFPEQEHGRFAWGEVGNLKPDTDYTVEVLYGSWSIYKQKIRTAKQEEPWQDDPHEDPDTGDPTQPPVPTFSAGETSVSYSVPLADYHENDQLSAQLINATGRTWEGEIEIVSGDYVCAICSFTDLEPGTEYTFRLMRGQELICVEMVSTLGVEEPEEAWFNPTEHSVFYCIPIPDYDENSYYALYVSQNGDFIDEYPVALSGDSLYVSDTFENLDPGCEITIQLVKDQRVIQEWIVYTDPETWLYPTESSFSYSIPLTDYQEMDTLKAVLLDASGETREGGVEVFSDHYVYATGWFSDLQPGTEYTFRLTKNGNLICEKTIFTIGVEEEQDEAWFDPSEHAISYYIPIPDYDENGYYALYLSQNGDSPIEYPAEISEDGSYVSGVFEELDSGCEFTIQLVKNQQVLDEWSVSTYPEAGFEVSETSIFYFIPVAEYQADDQFIALLLEPAGGERESYPEITIASDGSFASGQFADLSPGTEYTIRLMKNQNEMIYNGTVSTSEADWAITDGETGPNGGSPSNNG